MCMTTMLMKWDYRYLDSLFVQYIVELSIFFRLNHNNKKIKGKEIINKSNNQKN